jgi:hypothetical protein
MSGLVFVPPEQQVTPPTAMPSRRDKNHSRLAESGAEKKRRGIHGG